MEENKTGGSAHSLTAEEQLKIDTKLDGWKKKLLDLGLRNQLLNFKPQRSSNLKIDQSAGIDAVFSALVDKEKTLKLAEMESSDKVKERVLYLDDFEARQRQLRTIRSAARKSLAEKGVNILYMTFGMLRWQEKGTTGQEMMAPLLLVPVSLNNSSTFDPYELQVAEGEIVVNPTLLFKLENDFQITELPEMGEEEQPQAFIHRFVEALHQPQWSVEEEIYISLLSFQKINMYRDLQQHRERLYENKIVRALCGVKGDFAADEEAIREVGSRYDHDNLLSPLDTFHIVDADASQADAILLARKGVSFVLQGPPGTGKSQTITNIIATLLADGKKVLFVAEKEAALSVVKNRLAEHGMGDFCLMIDNDKAKKKDILQQIDNCIAQPKLTLKSDIDDRLHELEEKRSRLNHYYQQLTLEVDPLHKSIYDICGEIASRNAMPNVVFDIAQVEKIDGDRLRQMRSIVKDYIAAIGPYDSIQQNPWFGSNLNDVGINQQEQLKSLFAESASLLGKIEQTMGEVVLNMGLPLENSANQMEPMMRVLSLLSLPADYPAEWLSLDSLDALQGILPKKDRDEIEVQLQEVNGELETLRRSFEEQYDKDVVEIDAAMLDRFRNDYGGLMRGLNGQYRKDIATIASYSRKGKPDYEEALALLKQIKRFRELQEELQVLEGKRESLQPIFHAEAMRQAIEQYGLEADTIALLLTRDTTPRQAQSYLAQLEQLQHSDTLNKVKGYFSDQAWIYISQRSTMPLGERLKQCADHFESLRDWNGYQQARMDASTAGIASFIDAVEQSEEEIPKAYLEEVFLKQFYQLLLDHLLHEERFSDVGAFRQTAIMQLVADFRALDVEQLRIAQEKVRVQLIQSIPDFSFSNSAGSEIGTLKREIQKKRGQKPLRVLFQQIPNIITHIKPCFLMSPLAISAYLSDMDFDLVIFDEASQVFPENAIGAIMRGKQLIVVGDDRQLPPTNFFKAATMEVDEEDMDDDAAFESILDQSATVLPTMTLKWHYRSKSESLIAFSNAEIYNSRLISFPTRDITSSGHTPDLGVECVYVAEGVYDRGGKKDNVAEANKVIDLMKDHFLRFPKRSLGVVTFSEAQMDCIDSELLRRLKEDEELKRLYEQSLGREKEPFILKNLENIQGDERDTIIMSVGYGRDANGKLYNNMGPITRDGGYRRLNVAITRAKYNVKLVCSILPEDIRIDEANDTPTNGLRLLKSYIDYAQRGKVAIENDLRSSAAAVVDTAFEESVYQFLTAKGYQVDRLVGTSSFRINLAVVHPEAEKGYILAIECDGSAYLSARTARERDRVRPSMLRGMGWQLIRLWATDWVRNRANQEERLLNAISAAMEGKPVEVYPETVLSPMALSEIDGGKERQQSAANDKTVAANDNDLSPQESAIDLPTIPSDAPFVTYTEVSWDSHLMPKDNIMRIIEGEQPIAFDALCSRVAQHLAKVPKNLADTIRDMLSRESVVTDPLGFICMKGFDLHKLQCRIPIEGEKPRPIDCIHPQELRLALLFIAAQSFGTTREALVTDTARALGFKRTTDIVSSTLMHQIDTLLAAGALAMKEDKIEAMKNE